MAFSMTNCLTLSIVLDMAILLTNALFAQDDLTVYEPLPGEFPSAVSLLSRSEDNHNCIGVLITRWHTMTSCSCLTAPKYGNKQSKLVTDNYHLVAGITTLFSVKARGQKRKISVFVVHPDCEKDGKFVKYDIAVATSERPFEFGKYVQTAKIPFTMEPSKPSQSFDSILSKRNYATVSMVSWHKRARNNPSLIFVRMYIDKDSVSCKNVNDSSKEQEEEDVYTCVTFKTPYCPNFDEAAIFSDDRVFYGVATGIKGQICNKKPIFFTKIDNALEWIIHIVGKGNVGEFKPSINLILLLFPVTHRLK